MKKIILFLFTITIFLLGIDTCKAVYTAGDGTTGGSTTTKGSCKATTKNC